MQRLLLLSLLVLTLVGCADELPIGPGAPLIMPLDVGNRWIGRSIIYDSTGSIGSSRYDTLQIFSALVDPDGIWYVDGKQNLYRNNSSGLVMRTPNPYQAAKYPGMRGDTFNTFRVMQIPTDSGLIWTVLGFEVVSTDTSITVPAGTFSCYHYRNGMLFPPRGKGGYVESTFYAPDVGPVLRVVYRGNVPNPESRWELMGYSLK